jgi:hypothetical protein
VTDRHLLIDISNGFRTTWSARGLGSTLDT